MERGTDDVLRPAVVASGDRKSLRVWEVDGGDSTLPDLFQMELNIGVSVRVGGGIVLRGSVTTGRGFFELADAEVGVESDGRFITPSLSRPVVFKPAFPILREEAFPPTEDGEDDLRANVVRTGADALYLSLRWSPEYGLERG